jgi:hypothetical protein
MRKVLLDLIRDSRGVTVLEYTLWAFIIGGVSIAIWQGVGDSLRPVINTGTQNLTGIISSGF